MGAGANAAAVARVQKRVATESFIFEFEMSYE